MKILFLTQVLPYPLDAGAKVRQYHMRAMIQSTEEIEGACRGIPAVVQCARKVRESVVYRARRMIT